MPGPNNERREKIRKWLEENAKPYNEPQWLANLASAKFKIYYQPLWLDEMAEEAIGKAKER